MYIGESTPLKSVYHALRGYYVGIKTCLAGLVFVSDMNVSCFLAAGEMINLMWQAGGFRNFQVIALI